MKYVFLFLLLPITLIAQDLSVSGSVFDQETKQPLPGVAVYVDGSDVGAVTDFDGNFSISAEKGKTLVFTFIGMKTLKQTVESATMSVYMQADMTQLDEVTVSVGYFDVSKKDLSGSIAQVTSKELEKNRSSFVEQLLQGQVAGVVITDSSEPGGGTGISIRGTNSLMGGTQPLYVVDGIPIDPLTDAEGNTGGGQSQSSISNINPNDIDKIEVLKDAAATAVYGARGANGVVIITTKSATSQGGKDSFTVNAETTITQVAKNIDVLDGPTWESYMNQRALNDLYINITDPDELNPFDGTQLLAGSQRLDPSIYNDHPLQVQDFKQESTFFTNSRGVNTNWQDLTYQDAISNSVNVSYRGGNAQSSVFSSLGIQNNEGVIINSNNKRITSNTNIRKKAFNKKVDVFLRTILAYNSGNASSVSNGEIFTQRGIVSQALQFQPIFSLLEDGQNDEIYTEEFTDNEIPVSNPYTLATYLQDQKKSINFNQSIGIFSKLTPKLEWALKGAFNYQKSNRDTYYPINTTRGRRNNGEATQAFLENRKIYGETSFRYKNNFGKHRIDAIVVGTIEQNNIRALFNKAFGFKNDLTSYYTFENATDILVPVTQFREFGLLSGLARVGYNYKRRYYVDINARIDASSKFATNNKSAVFPSVALAWAASEEPFLRDSDIVSNLRLRASYGKTGSNPIAPYQSLAFIEPIRYNFDDNIATGNYEANLANNDLAWETTEQFNAGLDVGLLSSAVNITIDAYHKKTYDLLQSINLPPSNGYSSMIGNFGEIENKGIEFSINAAVVNSLDFSWSTSANIGFNRNKLVELNSNLDFQRGPIVGFSQRTPSVFMVGKPLGIFWGAQTDGVYANWEEAVASGIKYVSPGEIRYVNNHVDVDANGDPLIEQKINDDDFVQIGDPNPDFTAAITNNFSYRNWDMSILFTGQKGGDLFWVDSWQLQALQKSTNSLTSAFEDSWKAPLSIDSDGYVVYNPEVGSLTGVSHPAAKTNKAAEDNGPLDRTIVSDRQVYDASFIRLKNINISYTHNMKNNTSLKIFASANNLFVWTKYPGYDPEVQSYNKDPQRRGIDFGSYPGTKRFSIGLRFNY
jgi:TonB-linked SusC/RagA family outer membrane protein